eukprot:GGOE01003293.1.p1 GENE.GGOE01003293.1~~GGOE01003293.1.p1  ORF type:complete len:867 (-),score=188.69 GGOE01003293.1:465-3065(-)
MVVTEAYASGTLQGPTDVQLRKLLDDDDDDARSGPPARPTELKAAPTTAAHTVDVVECPAAIAISAELEQPAVSCAEGAKLLALCSLKAAGPKERTEAVTRPAICVCAVLDCSSSMRDHGKLELLRHVMLFVVDQLKAEDRLAVVAFATNVTVLLPLTPMDHRGKEQAQQAMRAMRADGRTNLSGGLLEGLRILAERPAGSALPSCWLLTDGAANEGLPETSIPKAASSYLSQMKASCSVYTFGIGNHHNSTLLRDIAGAGLGMYYYLQNCELIRQAFAVCLGGLSSIRAQNVRVRLTVHPPYAFGKLLNRYSVECPDPTTVVVQLGDLYEEEERGLLVQLQVPVVDPPSDAPVPICHWSVDYFDVPQCKPVRLSAQSALTRPATAPCRCRVPRALELQHCRVVLACAMDRARKAAATSLSEARAFLDAARRKLATSGQSSAPEVKQMLADLVSCEMQMVDQQTFLKSGDKTLNCLSLSYNLQRTTIAGSGCTAQFRTSAQADTVTLARDFLAKLAPSLPQCDTLPAVLLDSAPPYGLSSSSSSSSCSSSCSSSSVKSHSSQGSEILRIHRQDLQQITELRTTGTSRVTLCKHLPTGRHFAVKSSGSSKAIKQELRVLSRCRHPALVEFCGAYREGEQVFLCIAFMELGSVEKAILLLGPVEKDIICHWVADILSALEYLHTEMKVIHRDVKPSNLLLGGDGAVKLAELGLSSDGCCSAAFTLVGTPVYMAPERMAGQAYSFQVDSWGVGLCVYSCATAERPWKDCNVWQLICNIQEGQTPLLCEESFHPPMCDFVRQCLRQDPALRPTCAALRRHPWLQDFQTNGKALFADFYKEWLTSLRLKLRQATPAGAAAWPGSTGCVADL